MTDNKVIILAVTSIALAMFVVGMNVSKRLYESQIKNLEQQVKELKARKPVIIYQVDNAGSALVGKITSKNVVDGHYTVTIGAYGKFLVTKEQYDSLKIGDKAPEYLKKRGS